MTDFLSSLPEDERIFDGSRREQVLAVALETVVQDVSPAGDGETARKLGGYMLGEESPPEEAPEYVALEDGQLEMSNPPFLEATVDVSGADEVTVSFEFDSELDLLIDPPVCVTLEGPLTEVVEATEQMVAEIYRTKGRRLEMLDEGVIDPEEFAERR